MQQGWGCLILNLNEFLTMPNQTSDNNKRIAKNTLLLYFRMLLIMVVTLFTSRVVLYKLGVADCGICDAVG